MVVAVQSLAFYCFPLLTGLLLHVMRQRDHDSYLLRRQHSMGAASAHWQGSPYYMTHGALQRVRIRAVLHWQIYADLGNIDVAHDTAHGKLLGIGQGRGRSPSLGNGCAGQHGVVLLRRLPLLF